MNLSVSFLLPKRDLFSQYQAKIENKQFNYCVFDSKLSIILKYSR